MTTIDVAPIAALLSSYREQAMDDREISALQKAVHSALRTHRLRVRLDSKAFGNASRHRLTLIAQLARQLDRELSAMQTDSMSWTLAKHFPLAEGDGDETDEAYGAPSFIGMQKGLALLSSRASTEFAAMESGAIWRHTIAPADLLVHRLAKIFSDFTSLNATAGRAHKFNTDTSSAADSKFIRFAELALASMRSVEPSIAEYSRDSIASMMARKVRRGKSSAPKKRKIKAAGF